MTKEEKLTSVTVYLAKVVDELQGRVSQDRPLSTLQHLKPLSVGVTQAADESLLPSADNSMVYPVKPFVESEE